MSYKALVIEVAANHLHPHPNANRLQLLKTNGYTIVVGLNVREGDVGILFGTETPGKIEPWFLQEHDLYARRDEDGKNVSKGFFPANGRITSVNIRGVKSEGFFFVLRDDTHGLSHGDVIDSLNGKLLCSRYYIRQPKGQRSGKQRGPNAMSAQKLLAPNLVPIYDTEQFRLFVSQIPLGARLVTSLKMHGTSVRSGYVLSPLSWWQRLLNRFGINHDVYSFQTGTRRMLVADSRSGFYSMKDAFAKERLDWHERLQHKNIPKGVTVYGELVGYGYGGKPIMAPHTDNDGNKVVYHYGQEEGTNELYIYRVTQQSPDGFTTDFSYEQIVSFCNERGLNVVPLIETEHHVSHWDGDVARFIHWLEGLFETDAMQKPHQHEGVVIEVIDNDWRGPKKMKYKCQAFCEMESINYDNGLVDTEDIS